MKKFVLTTAMLLAGTALAGAQSVNAPAATGGNKTEQAAPAPTAQQNAPAEKVAPGMRNAPAQTTGQAAGQANGDRGGAQTTGQAPKAGADTKAGAQINGETPKAGADAKSNMRSDTTKSDTSKSTQSDTTKSDTTKSSAKDDAAGNDATRKTNNTAAKPDNDTKDATTGQGAAGGRGAANLSTEQRTKIRTVIKDKVKVQPETNVNFSINVGTRVPRTVHYHPLPAEVVTIYPEWRGYYFILVGDQIVVIEPSSFEIVAVLA